MQHVVNGAWTLAIRNDRGPREDYATAALHADGTMTITVSGYTAHGVWVPVDDQVAHLRAIAPLGPAEGQSGWHTLDLSMRATGDDSVSIDGTYSRPTPSGVATETMLHGSGERLVMGQAT